MIITDAQYKKIQGTETNGTVSATIDDVKMSVPMKTDNRHYAEILKQVDEGTITIAEAD